MSIFTQTKPALRNERRRAYCDDPGFQCWTVSASKAQICLSITAAAGLYISTDMAPALARALAAELLASADAAEIEPAKGA